MKLALKQSYIVLFMDAEEGTLIESLDDPDDDEDNSVLASEDPLKVPLIDDEEDTVPLEFPLVLIEPLDDPDNKKDELEDPVK